MPLNKETEPKLRLIPAVDYFRIFFLPVGSKNSNTDGGVCGLQGGATLKNRSYVVKFHESPMACPWTFQSTLVLVKI